MKKEPIRRMPKTNNEYKNVLLRLSEKTYAALKKLSITKSLSMNAIISQMLNEKLK